MGEPHFAGGSPESRLWEVVERTAREVTDEVGSFKSRDHQDALREALGDLPPHIKEFAAELQVKALCERFVRRRNPQPKRQQGSLYSDDAILPLGDGKRVWMQFAGSADLITWASLAAKNLARVAYSEANRGDYVAQRLDALRRYPDKLLGEVERLEFGYESPEHTDDDDGNDGPEDW